MTANALLLNGCMIDCNKSRLYQVGRHVRGTEDYAVALEPVELQGDKDLNDFDYKPLI